LPDAGLENNRLATRRKRTIAVVGRGMSFAKRSRVKGFARTYHAMEMIVKRSRDFVDIDIIDHPCVASRFKDRIMEQHPHINKIEGNLRFYILDRLIPYMAVIITHR